MIKKSTKFIGMVILVLIASLLQPSLLQANASATDTGNYAVIPDTKAANLTAAYAPWDSSKAYVSGDMVTYNGLNYKAKWWTQGEVPGTADVWQLVSDPNGSYEDWNSTKAYVGGDMVSYN
jgi:chitodextrinase